MLQLNSTIKNKVANHLGMDFNLCSILEEKI